MVFRRCSLTRGLLLLAVAASSGCRVTWLSDGGDGSTANGGADSGADWDDDLDARGGADEGGQGGQADLGGSGGSDAGEGGSGSKECIAEGGTGLSVASCDTMDVAFITTCPNTMLEPYAVAVCRKGFELYTEGAREALMSCLSAIPADLDVGCYDSDESATFECVSSTYEAACESADVALFCADARSFCDDADDVGFDEENCRFDLKPFSYEGLSRYAECYNARFEGTACVDLHELCVNEVGAL
jgi:hypothetical protein